MTLLLVHSLVMIIVGGFLFRLLALSVLALRKTPEVCAPTERLCRFAVLVPAHNEELSIAGTIRSLRSVEYPAHAFDVVVIADNCSDGTAAVALREGARVLVREVSGLRGKGYALRWCFDQLEGSGYDAYVVVDADSTVSANFLSVLNAYRQAGAEAIQCNDQVKPLPGSWSAEAIRAGFILYNYVRPAGRRVLGFPAGLRGNGMCFAPELLRRVSWSAFSRAEDLEYSLMLALEGIDIQFAPEATVLATMTRDPRLAESQRARWEAGRLPLVKRFSLPLLGAALRRRSLMILDVCIDLITPALVNLVALAALGLVAAIVQWWLGNPEMLLAAILWAAVVACGLLHAVVGLAAAGAWRLLLSLAGIVPRYTIWKLRLYMKLVLRGDTTEWKRTVREPERSI